MLVLVFGIIMCTILCFIVFPVCWCYFRATNVYTTDAEVSLEKPDNERRPLLPKIILTSSTKDGNVVSLIRMFPLDTRIPSPIKRVHEDKDTCISGVDDISPDLTTVANKDTQSIHSTVVGWE